MRFTLAKLLLAIAIAGIACAGMTFRTELWAIAIATLTIVLYWMAAIRAIRLSGRDRAAAIAFAATGIVYMLMVASPIRGWLLTNYPLGIAAQRSETLQFYIPSAGADKYGYAPGTVAPAKIVPIRVLARGAMYTTDLDYEDGAYFLIGHCVFSWLLALFGGWYAGSMFQKRENK